MRPELLAVRAINQYKHRDIIAYLGLRYYLQNDCARQNIWIKDVATHLVNTRKSPVYFQSKHFKEINKDSSNGNNIVYRNIYLPGPNEMLAESYLLHACSSIASFQSIDCVYSYHFPETSSKEGIFKSYFQGFQKRNEFIHEICTERKDFETKILFTDVKKFYPNISAQLAQETWDKACDVGDVSGNIRMLGDSLLQYYRDIATANQEGSGLLTGPMFSHLIANMVLMEIDKFMFSRMSNQYCRYVDDFVLIGNSEEIKVGRNLLGEKLDQLGLKLHDEEKDFEVSSSEWLECNKILPEINSNFWNYFVADLKRFLLVKPELKEELQMAFLSQDIRIPLLNYSSVIQESSYVERFSDWLKKNYSWGLKSIKSLSIQDLVSCALVVRKVYEGQLNILLDNDPIDNAYYKKQLISRVRFYANRLTYLSNTETLSSLSSDLNMFPELTVQAKIMQTICSKNISDLIKFGSNACQSVAEAMDAQNSQVTCSIQELNDVDLQSLAMFNFYGIKIHFKHNAQDALDRDPLCQFSLYKNTQKLMKSDNLFVQELACLRGMDNPMTHKSILNSAFDRNEELSFSIIDKFQGSGYY